MIELLWNNPISEARMRHYLDCLELREGQFAMDFGCGCGELLIRLHEQYQIQGTGIDSSELHIAEAQRRASDRAATSAIHFATMDAKECFVTAASVDLAVCLGSTHVFGLGSDAYSRAIKTMVPMLNPRGILMIGDGYMKQPACTEYRELLGEDMPDDMTHASNVAVAKDLGLVPLAAWTSSEEEWDDFEWTYQRIVESRAKSNPTDLEAQQTLEKRRKWMDGYLKWGRDTLGFGVYLFRK